MAILTTLAASAALKKAKAVLTAIPWPVYALAALVAAFWLYGNHREGVGEDRVQAAWDAEKARLAAEVAAAEKSAREKEARDRAAFDAALTLLELENANARAELEQDLADLRADNARLRVRGRFQCPATAGVSGTAAGSAGSDEAPQAGLLREDAEFLLRIGREADDVVRQLTACQAILNAERQ